MNGIEFPRSVVIIVTVLVLLNMTGWVVGLVGIWVADSYVTPAVSEQSYPQPRLY